MYLDYDKNKTYVLDIEADSLTPTVLWCMCWEYQGDGSTGDCIGEDEVRDFFTDKAGCVFVFQNGLKFDGPVLQELLGVKANVTNIIDTLVLSTLYSPSITGGHSLAAWGERLGFPKGDHNDFSCFSQEMLRYCRQDVKITGILFRRLIKTLSRIGFSERSIWIEHRFTVILDRQCRNGVYFDGPRALSLYSKIRSREQQLTEEIQLAFPPTETLVRTSNVFTKDGRHTAIYEKDVHRYRVVISGDSTQYQAYESVPFGIGSSKQRIEKLVQLGWEPLEFTKKTKKGGGGNPQPFDKGKLAPSLELFLEDHPKPEVEMIARWMSLNGRANMINGWLNEWDEDTGCIHGSIWTADTLRRRHEKPNTANIPAVRLDKEGNILFEEDGYYTYEARDVWTARPGRVLCGTDAKSLEYRMLGHHVNNPELTNVILTSDVHINTQKLAGLDTKAKGKTLNFALIYGGQDPKIGSIVGGTRADGARLRKLIYDKIPGLGGAIEEAKQEFRNGRIELCDGSKIICPMEHASFNYKLQGGGARVMALGAILLERHIYREGLDSIKVLDVHDEWQYDVAPKDADRHMELANQSLREAGEHLNLNIPMEGESKKGLTWSETH